jgi:hypothetical protein
MKIIFSIPSPPLTKFLFITCPHNTRKNKRIGRKAKILLHVPKKMNKLFEAALEIQTFLEVNNRLFCFIGGLAVLR